MLDLLLESIYTQSPQKIWDNIGIKIDVAEKVPTLQELWEAHDRAYGSGLLSRFWMRHVYPALFPKRHKALIDRCNDLAIRCKQEFLDAILEQGETALASEDVLRRDWEHPDEDAAWKDL